MIAGIAMHWLDVTQLGKNSSMVLRRLAAQSASSSEFLKAKATESAVQQFKHIRTTAERVLPATPQYSKPLLKTKLSMII